MRYYLIFIVLLFALPVGAESWLLEVEGLATAGSEWKVTEMPGASGGKVLFNTYYDASDEAHGALALPHPGRWRLWVRYYNIAGAHGQFRFTLRDMDGAIVAQRIMAVTPAERTGLRWESMDAVAPFAGTYQAAVARITYAKSPYDARNIDLILATDDPAAAPEAALAKAKPATVQLTATPIIPPVDTPYLSTAPMNDWRFFSGAGKDEPFRLSVTQTPSGDLVQMIRYGGNAAEGYRPGFPSLPLASAAFSMLPESFPAEVRAQGRVLGVDGKELPWHSIFYPPFNNYILERSSEFGKELGAGDADRQLIGWTLTNEMGGYFDWSTYGQQAFRQWLTFHYGDVAKLNAMWGTAYPSFDAVQAPRDRTNLAAWIDWWHFHEAAWAQFIATEAKARYDAELTHPPVMVKFSDLDLEYPNFVGDRSIDYELMAEALKPYGNHFAMDIYGSGDLVGFEAELLRSVTGGPYWFTEYNQHNDDARAMQANLWSATAKGLRGMFIFCWGGLLADRHPDWTGFGMHTADGNPKTRMLTAAQYFHGVHRLEPLLLGSQPVKTKGTIGLYYPRLDIGIGGLPAQSTYGETVDPLIPVYASLRRLGYPVEIVTERQLLAGKLDGLTAMVFVNAQHLPAKACEKVSTYVRNGGTVIADARTGWYDDHHRVQRGLNALFGIEEGPAGYDAQAAAEFQTSPNTRWTSLGCEDVQLRKGAYLLARFGAGEACAVGNASGTGHTVYFATMLGSAKPTGTGDGLLREFLRQAGVPPPYTVDTPSDGLRVEPAWQDTGGNQYVILTNYGEPTGAFTLSLPPQVNGRPRLALWADGRSMALEPMKLTRIKGTTTVKLPGVDTAGTLLLLKDYQPLIGARLTGVTEQDTGLEVLHPGQKVTLEITVYNAARTPCRDAQVHLYTPRGWLQEAAGKPLPALKPGECRTLTIAFRVPATERPQIAPVTVKLERGGEAIAAPCTLMVKVAE